MMLEHYQQSNDLYNIFQRILILTLNIYSKQFTATFCQNNVVNTVGTYHFSTYWYLLWIKMTSGPLDNCFKKFTLFMLYNTFVKSNKKPTHVGHSMFVMMIHHRLCITLWDFCMFTFLFVYWPVYFECVYYPRARQNKVFFSSFFLYLHLYAITSSTVYKTHQNIAPRDIL